MKPLQWLLNSARTVIDHRMVARRDVRFDFKVGQISPKMGQIRDFFRSDFSTFLGDILTHFEGKPDIPDLHHLLSSLLPTTYTGISDLASF